MMLGLALLLLAGRAVAAEVRSGEQIYRQQCASCHGASGEGTDDAPQPLMGDRSVDQLASLIARTMPKDAPKGKKCPADDARKVAAYIHEAFYSRAAQERSQPPRIELSRLTVRQYRQSLADLIGAFRAPAPKDAKSGLRGEYYKSRRFRDFDRVLDRVDPMVRFDFGTAAPDAKLDASQFSIRWTGSVLAPDTGTYEFIVRTEHATRLWVNDTKRPLIDAWVKSGNDNEYRASIYLLGGRVYPLRLEFSKAKQGVDDSKKTKTKPPAVKASIALEWKMPGRIAEAIPPRNLLSQSGAVVYVPATPFPPDDRSVGYERGTSISKAWEQATTDAAIEAADYLAVRLPELAGVRDDAADRVAKLQDFCRRFAERAFRRPLDDEQIKRYIERQFAVAKDPQTAVKRVVLLVLKSPRFLYREIPPHPTLSPSGGEGRVRGDAYDTASRISFGLWDSLPDQELLQAAASGKLSTREDVKRQVERMAGDLRTRAKLREFFLQWLKVESVPELSKDPAQYPGFDKVAAADLRTSLELFLEDVLYSEASDFRQLILSESLFLNGRLGKLYGADLPPDAPFQKVAFKGGERAGVLTHPYLMAAFAYTATSSPIHRGVFLARNVLGQTLRPPPEASAPLAPDLHPQLTTRERVLLQTKPEACQSCHSMINPLGFTLENFDAIGRYRNKEKGRPIDATGSYLTRKGEVVKFVGVRELAQFLARSDETHEAFVEQLFHYLVKQPIRAYGPRKLEDLRQTFADNRFSIRRLVTEIIVESALAPRESVK